MIYPFAFIINDEAEVKLFTDFIRRFTSEEHISWTQAYSNSEGTSPYPYKIPGEPPYLFKLPAVLGMVSKVRSWDTSLARYGSVERLRKDYPSMPPILNKDILHNPDNYPEYFL